MSERLANWVRNQQRLVCDGIKASHIRLEGPDETTWATWSCETENLPDVIAQALIDFSEEVSKGSHGARLIACTSNGKQLGMLPQTITGNAAKTHSRAQEAVTNARATAMNVSTAQSQLDSMARRAEAAEERSFQMMTHFFRMTEVVTNMQRASVEEDGRRLEAAARADAMVRIGGAVAEHAGPLMALLTNFVAQKIDQGGADAPTRTEPDHTPVDDRPEAAPTNSRPHGGRGKRAAPRTTTTRKQG